MPDQLKALTIHQPYASAIILGHKLFETRTWHPGNVEQFVLHAGQQIATPAQTALKRYVPDWADADQLPRGAALGIVKIAEVYRAYELEEHFADEIDELEFMIGKFTPSDMYAWELEVIKTFHNPIPARGQQGFWNWTQHIRQPS